MKNHPVNNDYVQNLQEGLLNEAALRMGKKEKGAKPRKTHVGEEDNMGNVATNSARRKNIKDVGMEPMSGTGPGEVRPFNSGSTTTRKLKKVDENIVKNKNSKYPGRIGGSSGSVLPGAKNSELDSAKERFKKGLKLENAEVGYPERGIKGGTAEAKAYENRVAMKKKYQQKVEDKTRDRLAAAPALASIQKESYDIVDSRLSPEDAKIEQNTKTRGVKKKKGEKPVPMTNSDGEKIGEQDSGTRPRSQDLNTRGRLNKKREGEGMIAKGKRFIKKKFS